MSVAELIDDTAPLFEAGGPMSVAALAEFRADPRLPEAIRRFASGMIAIYRGNRLLNALINDRGRMAIGYFALYLHDGGAPDGRGRGFGVGQLKAICAASGMASPGRTGAMLALMRMSGYIASARAPDDRRRHILVPTERLRELHRVRWQCVADTLRAIRPDAGAAFALGDPEFEAAYVRYTAGYFAAGMRILDIVPEMQLFADRNAGLMILFSIMLAGEDGDTIPPQRPCSISISALANRFGVSRVHVRTLLRDAEAAGLIERTEGGNKILLRPKMIEAFKNFCAASLLYVGYCAQQAAAETTSRAG